MRSAAEYITFQWGPPVFPKILYDRGRKNLLTAKAEFGTGEALSAKLLTREATVSHLTGALGQGVHKALIFFLLNLAIFSRTAKRHYFVY